MIISGIAGPVIRNKGTRLKIMIKNLFDTITNF